MITKRRVPYLFLLPYLILFTVFIIIPTVMAIGLSFTNYNAVQTPRFLGLTNYIKRARAMWWLEAAMSMARSASSTGLWDD